MVLSLALFPATIPLFFSFPTSSAILRGRIYS